MKIISTALFLILNSFTLFCEAYPSAFAKEIQVTKEEYAVYSAVIEAMFVKEKVKTIVIAEHTTFYSYRSIWEKPEDYIRSMLEQLRPISLDTVEDLEKKNEEEAPLEYQFDLTVGYVLFGKQAPTNRPEAFEEQWRSFYSKYPDSPGIISLSRVGFNADRRQAAVYVANSCGGLCGKGYYVLLTKSNRGWSIENELMLWIS